MLDQLLGSYLVAHNVLTDSQFEEIQEAQHKSRVKLGTIAVSEKLITKEQADEINHLQTSEDKRFGDIAIEHGYLTEQQLQKLLDMQGNSYLQFVQTVIEKQLLSYKQIDDSLAQFQIENHISNQDIEILKRGDIDEIIPLFVHFNAPFYNEIIGLVIRNLIRFVNPNILLHDAYITTEYTAMHMAYQHIKGDHNILLGLSGKGTSLLCIANPFADEEFTEVDEDAFDSIDELINCINGLFASSQSENDIEMDMLPPGYCNNETLSADKLVVVPCTINKNDFDIIVSVDGKIEMNNGREL